MSIENIKELSENELRLLIADLQKEIGVKTIWKFPKTLIPELKKEYLLGNWLWLINQWNFYQIGEKICSFCPGSVNIVREGLKSIFIADAEVIFYEGRKASQQELVELFVKYVSPVPDPFVVQKIAGRTLTGTIAAFANADLKARGASSNRRERILQTVFGVSRATFRARYCNEC